MQVTGFVVQEHTTAEGVHWDFMLEQGKVLKTFRLEEPPQRALREAVRAIPIFDHALRFLTYEGPVQNGAGSVKIVDRGQCRLQDRLDNRWVMELYGAVLAGCFVLGPDQDDTWFLSPGDIPDVRQA